MKRLFPIFLIFTVLLGQDTLRNKIITDHFYYPTEGLNKIVVELSYSLGEAKISGTRNGGINGKVKYQPGVMSPVISFEKRGTTGYFELDMKGSRGKSVSLRGLDGVDRLSDNNAMEFFFPTDIPLEINFDLGLGEADIDLTDMTIESLEIESGVSDVMVFMNTPNKMLCRKFDVTNGIGDFNGKSLGNLRAERVNIEVGLGNMDMDFTGDVVEDCDISAEVGLGSLDITLPRDINGYVDVNKSFLSSVSFPPGLTTDRLPGRKTFQIRIDVGVGSVDVRQR